MAKKRTRPVTPPMRDNPLDMGLVNSIGAEPSQRVIERAPEPRARPVPAEPETAIISREPKPSPAPVARPSTEIDRAAAQERIRRTPSNNGRELEKDTYQLKTRFSTLESEQIEVFRRSLEGRLGVKLKATQISRALWTLALRAEEELESIQAPALRRPSYGDPLGMAAFEDEIANYLLLALKRTKRQS